MPRYDFTCQECGNVFETVVPLHNTEPVPCPKCEKTDVVKHFPCPAVHVFYSPCHPRHKRGMVGQKPPAVEPQFCKDAPYLTKKKKRKKKV